VNTRQRVYPGLQWTLNWRGIELGTLALGALPGLCTLPLALASHHIAWTLALVCGGLVGMGLLQYRQPGRLLQRLARSFLQPTQLSPFIPDQRARPFPIPREVVRWR
jgi:hypothetical protein